MCHAQIDMKKVMIGRLKEKTKSTFDLTLQQLEIELAEIIQNHDVHDCRLSTVTLNVPILK